MSEEGDYYSYKPLVTLDRPVALVGLPGCNAMQTARVATMITGLGTLLLPRAVAHRLSMDVEGLLIQNRDDELHATERELLQRAMDERTPKVIALGPTTTDDPGCLALLERTRIVHLVQTIPEALHNLQNDMVEDPRKHQHLKRYGAISEANLRTLFLQRTRAYSALADVDVPLDGRRPLAVGRSLPALLGW